MDGRGGGKFFPDGYCFFLLLHIYAEDLLPPQKDAHFHDK
jgi:hypothetical protein